MARTDIDRTGLRRWTMDNRENRIGIETCKFISTVAMTHRREERRGQERSGAERRREEEERKGEEKRRD